MKLALRAKALTEVQLEALVIPWGPKALQRTPAAETGGAWPHKILSIGWGLVLLRETLGGAKKTQAQAHVEGGSGASTCGIVLASRPMAWTGAVKLKNASTSWIFFYICAHTYPTKTSTEKKTERSDSESESGTSLATGTWSGAELRSGVELADVGLPATQSPAHGWLSDSESGSWGRASNRDPAPKTNQVWACRRYLFMTGATRMQNP
mgnify:CR=1 FL=1